MKGKERTMKDYYENIKSAATDYVMAYVEMLYPFQYVYDVDGNKRPKEHINAWIRSYMDEALDDILSDAIQFPAQTFPADGQVKRLDNRIEYRLLDEMNNAVSIINEHDWA